MKWSKYNLLFTSEKYGHLLYNALTNSFASVDEGTYQQLQLIRQSPETYDVTGAPGLVLQLRKIKALVEEHEEDRLLNTLQLRRLYSKINPFSSKLTIVPTLACNFNCPYCYEHSRNQIYMSEETEDQIIGFIEEHLLKWFGTHFVLEVKWYGGEPMLCFDTICRLTEKIKQTGVRFTAGMVTNGYLLTPEASEKLDELKIRHIQITLDGPEEIHDTRRTLINGGKTFRKIINNIEALLKVWKGNLAIRVNIDKSNQEMFPQIHQYLTTTFKGAKLHIYPGIVHDSNGGHPDMSCLFTKKEEAEFEIQQYRRHGIDLKHSYPDDFRSGCMASRKNDFVIGPEGELYKCWHDLGMKEKSVGSIYDEVPWNMPLSADYMVGTDNFHDPTCRQCLCFPVCDGGCTDMRWKNKRENASFEPCLIFKHALPELLEIHYEKILKEAEKKKQKKSTVHTFKQQVFSTNKSPAVNGIAA